MAYLALCVSMMIKSVLEQFMGDSLDKKVLVEFSVPQIDLEVRISVMDIISFAISSGVIGLYMWTDHWILNNVIAIAFAV